MDLEARLLDAWETGMGEPMPLRALTLIRASEPLTPREQIAGWSLGRCHRHLLQFRRALFGRTMACRLSCPECEEASELALDASSFLEESDCGSDGTTSESDLEMNAGDHRIVFRLPAPGDMDAASSCSNVEEARRLLASRCISSLECRGEPLSGEIPDHIIDAVSERMAEADPFADIAFATECAVCSRRWDARFDILGFLWSEIDRWARRLLEEIHTLASAYGWTQGEILSLAPGRRRRYVNLAVQ